MKHLSSIVLAVAVVAAFATACFTDPTSSLRKGPSRIELTRSAVTLATGDSISIQAELKDDQGNTYDASSVQWATDDAAVATVRVDSTQVPYNAFSRSFVVAKSPTGGVAHITVTSGSISSSFRVLNLPAGFTPSAPTSFRGATNLTDTVVTRNPDLTVSRDIFTTGDTVVFKLPAGSTLSFSATGSTVSFGAAKAYILAQSADSIKVVARNAFHGRPWITNLTWHGPAEVGDVAIDSLQGDVLAVAKPRYRGAFAVGGGLVLTINAPPTGLTFRTAAPLTGVVLHGIPAPVLSRTTTQIVVYDTVRGDTAGYTGGAIVTNVDYSGGIRFDSLWTTASITIAQTAFTGTISTPAGLEDTIYVVALGQLNPTTNVIIGGKTAFPLRRTADTIEVMAVVPGNNQAFTVTNVTKGGTTFPSLAPNGVTVNIPSAPTHEPNEPGNDARATATPFSFTGVADTVYLYGTLDCEDDGTACPGNGDVIDYFSINFAGTQNLSAQLTWFGNGTGGSGYNDTNNPDMDICIRSATSFLGTCTSTNGAGLNMPETATTNVAGGLLPGTYWIRVMAWLTPAPTNYQVRVIRVP